MKKIINPFIVLPLLLVIGLAACTNYGKKATKGHVEIYYKDGISQEQAQKAADFLYGIDVSVNNNTTVKKSIQLIKEGDTVNFRMVIDKKKLSGVNDENFYALGNVISDSLFGGKPVNVDLTDNTFKTIRTMHYKKMNFNEPAPTDSIQ
jgi:hypothetical protein